MQTKYYAMIVAMGSVLSTHALAESTVTASGASQYWPTRESVKYFDPLYHYSITIPKGWYISPTPANAVYGAAVFYNYKPDSLKRGYAGPSNALKMQIGVAPLAIGQDFQSWVAKWMDFEVNNEMNKDVNLAAASQRPAKVGLFNGVKYIVTGPGQSVMELVLLLDKERVMVIGLTPADSPAIPMAMRTLASVSVKHSHIFANDVLRLADEWARAPFPLGRLSGAPSPTATKSFPLRPADAGTNAPNSPITLYMPFQSGERWTVGAVGSFYGDGAHLNSNADYYATDWNLSTGDDFGAAVLPVADGTISDALAPTPAAPTCTIGGYGCYVIVDHASDIRTRYAHLSAVERTSGSVSHTDRIGSVGSTGMSTGPHLHLSFQQRTLSGAYVSYCWNNGNTCPNGESPVSPQTPKPSPMTTADGSETIRDGGSYTSNNGPDGIPVITAVNFPSSIPGDRVSVPGTVTFTDSNAGINWAQFDVAQDTCGGCFAPFGFDPGVGSLTKGQFAFHMWCEGDYSWTMRTTLRDVQGHVSNPYMFSVQCNPVPSARSMDSAFLPGGGGGY